MPTASVKAQPGHALAGNRVLYSELRKIDHHGIATYLTRCGLYVAKDRLAPPGQPVACRGCQAAREGAP